MNKLFLVTLLLVILAPATAITTAMYYEAQQPIDIKVPCLVNYTYCSAGATCNISIYDPNETIIVANEPMTNSIYYFNYTLNETQTNKTGDYRNVVVCEDSGLAGFTAYTMTVTWNGRAPPGDNVKIFFILAFLGILIALIYTSINSIKQTALFEIEIKEVMYSLITYCVVIALWFFNRLYMGDSFFNDVSTLAIEIGAFTNIIIPFIGFIITWFHFATAQKEWSKEHD